jgi:hypothetical protein
MFHTVWLVLFCWNKVQNAEYRNWPEWGIPLSYYSFPHILPSPPKKMLVDASMRRELSTYNGIQGKEKQRKKD